ncbi:MAG: hypothetical protein IT305_12495 [Chloroflexi bacterium]|nr:hypothetical protein [Chloroflexota bacterium]
MERQQTSSGKEEHAASARRGAGRIGRRHVLAGLSFVGQPTAEADLARLLAGLTGRAVTTGDVRRVARADERAYARNAGLLDDHVAPALAGDSSQPLAGLLTRSDWPLAQRLICGRTLRVAHLRTTLALVARARLAVLEMGRGPALDALIRRYGGSVSGAVRWGEGLDLNRVEQAVQVELAAISEPDTRERQASALVLGALSRPFQLWGRPYVVASLKAEVRRQAR